MEPSGTPWNLCSALQLLHPRRRDARQQRADAARCVTSTSAPAHAWRCQSRYGDDRVGEDLHRQRRDRLREVGAKNRLLSAVKSSGAVSPAIRASASRMPVMMPGQRRRQRRR